MRKMRERIVNMAKKIGKWKYLLAALFVVLACVVVELASNWNLLFLPEGERGLQQVNLEGRAEWGMKKPDMLWMSGRAAP